MPGSIADHRTSTCGSKFHKDARIVFPIFAHPRETEEPVHSTSFDETVTVINYVLRLTL
jgi:hypothetical protein